MRPASRNPYANMTFRGVGGKSMKRPPSRIALGASTRTSSSPISSTMSRVISGSRS